MSDSVILWVHGDCLSPQNPVLVRHPGAPAIFVWDEDLLDRYGLTLKRIVFMYECLLELPVVIRRGDVAHEVCAFARAHGATRVITTESPSPRFAAIRTRITGTLPVDVLSLPPFALPRRSPDLARFSRYWRAVEESVYRPADE